MVKFLLNFSRRWYQQPVKRRYVVACLAFLGFCVIYMLRVNLSVAIVAMTANRTHTADDGTITVVNIELECMSTMNLLHKIITVSGFHLGKADSGRDLRIVFLWLHLYANSWRLAGHKVWRQTNFLNWHCSYFNFDSINTIFDPDWHWISYYYTNS